MKPSTSFAIDRSIAILCVGEPKSGKTRLAMSFPDPGIIDCDGNLSSAVRVSAGKKFFFAQPFASEDGKSIPEAERWLRAEKEIKEMLVSPDVKTIVIDGLSNLCRWGLVYAEDQLAKSGINIKKEYLAKYAAFIPLLSNLVTLIRIGGKYVVVNVHQVLEKEELSGRIKYKFDIPGRLADNIGGQFTDVIAMDSMPDPGSKFGAKYVIRTKPTGYHPNLGTSTDLDPAIDITGKTPAEIWTILSPKLSASAGNQTNPQPQPTK